MPVNHQAVHLALRNRALPALPAGRAWENVNYTPAAGTPYVEEDYEPATSALLGLVSGGTVEDTALYVIRWFGVAGTGMAAINAGVAAILALFKPGDKIIATDGTVIRVRGDIAPTRGTMHNPEPGWAMVPVNIYIRVFHQNT